MLSKEEIEHIKGLGEEAISKTILNLKQNGDLLYFLDHLGRLEDDYTGDWLIELLDHQNDQVRCSAVKNLGKIRNNKHVDRLLKIARCDKNSMIRREAISSIGRLRDERNINHLFEFLGDKDPKVVCQAIRGLLVFKGQGIIVNSLKLPIKHENEMMRIVIYKEYFVKAA